MKFVFYAVNGVMIKANTIIQQHNGRIEQTDESLLLDIYFLNKRQ